MHYEIGVITVVQEARFRLSSDAGQSLLCALDRRAKLEPQDLPALLGRRVEVACSRPPARKALTAHAIRLAGAA